MQQTIRYATAELPGTTYVKHTVTLDDDARTIRVADPRSLATVVELQYVTADGPVVILLHGWPYDIHSFEQVAPALAAKGYRVLVPYVRGYGQTRFLSAATPRNAQPSALASDVIAFMDALHIQRAVLAGFDEDGGD